MVCVVALWEFRVMEDDHLQHYFAVGEFTSESADVKTGEAFHTMFLIIFAVKLVTLLCKEPWPLKP
ncbi:hypothetical protein D9M69_593870 [compost metagenome]